jgi:hypothetical protein
MCSRTVTYKVGGKTELSERQNNIYIMASSKMIIAKEGEYSLMYSREIWSIK